MMFLACPEAGDEVYPRFDAAGAIGVRRNRLIDFLIQLCEAIGLQRRGSAEDWA